ncbi:MAG: hypothetical protein ACT4QF_20510 [Sporichthyaceae bacterium]
MNEPVPLVRRPRGRPHRPPWLFRIEAAQHQRLGARARLRGLANTANNVDPEDLDLDWLDWQWSLGWLYSDAIVVAVGGGALTALRGRPRSDCPWPTGGDETTPLLRDHWLFGHWRRGGREMAEERRREACRVVPFPERPG